MITLQNIKSAFLNDQGVIQRYAEYLPVTNKTPIISLNEGSTPLIHSPKLSEKIGRDCQVYIKYEGLNPTASFKDRGMTLAISKARENNAQAVICASTGNTSASAAAYAARASLKCVVLIPEGKIAKSKLTQAIVYGAKVLAIQGNFDVALSLVREIGQSGKACIVNSINPDRIEGQKTAAFEIIDDLGDAPHIHILPVGNAGNITAYWKGYREFAEKGKSTCCPKMIGIQAEGAAPIYYNRVIDQPSTLASAIMIGNPASWEGASEAIQQSGGAVDIVSDQDLLRAQRWLAQEEGIFIEPASAASIAGLMQLFDPSAPGKIALEPGSTIVCTATGHGLKDSESALIDAPSPIRASADIEEILKILQP